MRVHGVGPGGAKSVAAPAAAHTPRQLDRRLHFGKHALGFLDALQARLAEPFVLGNGAHSVNLLLDISRNELPIATHTSRQIDKVVCMADSADTLSDLLALLADALVLLASHFQLPARAGSRLAVSFGGRPGPRF